jgi:hypothetical protein
MKATANELLAELETLRSRAETAIREAVKNLDGYINLRDNSLPLDNGDEELIALRHDGIDVTDNRGYQERRDYASLSAEDLVAVLAAMENRGLVFTVQWKAGE